MGFHPLDPGQFIGSGIFHQDEFLAGIDNYDWNRHRDQKILVRGCSDIHTPVWAFMVIAARLTGIARSVRYGNEHDNVVIYRKKVRKINCAPDNIPT